MPIAIPAMNAAQISARGRAVPFIAASVNACASTAAARPVVSLSGRSAVNQASGDSTTTTVVHHARRSEGSNARNNVKSGKIISPPQMALQIASPRGSGDPMPLSRSIPVDSLASAMKTG
jgi:hypothetical protein